MSLYAESLSEITTVCVESGCFDLFVTVYMAVFTVRKYCSKNCIKIDFFYRGDDHVC